MKQSPMKPIMLIVRDPDLAKAPKCGTCYSLSKYIDN